MHTLSEAHLPRRGDSDRRSGVSVATSGWRWRPFRGDIALPAQITDFLADRNGVTAVLTAIAMTGLLGFAGLATEVGVWYSVKRQMQGAADSAALSAANGLAAGDAQGVPVQAGAVVAQYGWVDGAAHAQVIVNNPPASGGFAGNNKAVEVIVQQPQPLLFSALFITATPTVGARAVALAGATSGKDCVLALDPAKSGAVTANGSPTVNLGCGIAVNSSNASALLLNGNATINASSASIVGGVSVNGPSHLNSPDIKTGAATTDDPYHATAPPPFSGCTFPGGITLNGSGNKTLSPGVYCGNITINGGVNVTMQPGIYVLDRGSLIVNGNPTLTGSGVSVVFTSSTTSGIGSLSDNGNPTVNLTAPSSGEMAGFIFYQDRRAASGGSNTFNGNSGSVLTGALYFPSQQLTFNGNPTTTAGCTQLIADSITFNGHPQLDDKCDGVGVQPIGASPSKLVE